MPQSVNGFTKPQEKLGHDTLDDVASMLEFLAEETGCVPGLWKADVESAFRRIPIRPSHRWVCGFGFKHDDDVWVSEHYACPFGAVASVHAWERVGEAIARIARVILKLPVCRYVDDYFSAERCAPCSVA